MCVDKAMRRITVSIDMALTNKPQLLPYMRKKILEDITYNIRTLTDSEVEEYLSTAVGVFDGKTSEEG